jgi:hypothetical protein
VPRLGAGSLLSARTLTPPHSLKRHLCPQWCDVHPSQLLGPGTPFKSYDLGKVTIEQIKVGVASCIAAIRCIDRLQSIAWDKGGMVWAVNATLLSDAAPTFLANNP